MLGDAVCLSRETLIEALNLLDATARQWSAVAKRWQK
jgi:hypothetical protein